MCEDECINAFPSKLASAIQGLLLSDDAVARWTYEIDPKMLLENMALKNIPTEGTDFSLI